MSPRVKARKSKRAAKSRYQKRASSKPGPRVPGTPVKRRRVASPVIPGTAGPTETADVAKVADVGAGSTGDGLDVGQPIPDKPTGEA